MVVLQQICSLMCSFVITLFQPFIEWLDIKACTYVHMLRERHYNLPDTLGGGGGGGGVGVWGGVAWDSETNLWIHIFN